ncbi:MAG: dihydroxyacetone kinase subunit L [Vibrionaceae bacterium]|nr:dihydroxyacetone kinase subunit L [Vibrionaceae bacterium]
MQIEKQHIIHWLELCHSTYQENQTYLDELDSDIGDGDHGHNLSRSFAAVAKELDALQKQSISTILKNTGLTLRMYLGGASGIFYSTFFFCVSNSIGSRTHLSPTQLFEALKHGADGIAARGKAKQGDKTMYDVWAVALETAKSHSNSELTVDEFLDVVLKSAETAAISTVDMEAAKGRAQQKGKESVGHQDPGATSSYLMIKSLVTALKSELI